MKDKKPKNLAASIQHRLLDHARKSKAEPQLVLMRFAVERLLYRLSQSENADAFVVKGALLFLVWTGEPHRATKDLDLLALTSGTLERFEEIFRKLCDFTVPDDGLIFLGQSVTAEDIRESNVYRGVRVTLEARLGKMRLPLQVDVGFGDAVTPKAAKADFPTLLDFPIPHLAMYPKETVIAEKFETMAKLGVVNSRMKDYYDVWLLSREFEFEGAVLRKAIQATFKRRQTKLPPDLPLALTAEFSGDAMKQRQWQAFIKRGGLKITEHELEKVVKVIGAFLGPVTKAASLNQAWSARWSRGGPWKVK